MSHSFQDVALVLLGHGSSADPQAAAAVAGQAARLRQRGLFASVAEAFLRHPPSLAEVLANAPSPHLLVVPGPLRPSPNATV